MSTFVSLLRSASESAAKHTDRLHVGYHTKQVAQLSQRDRAAGWVSYGQKLKTVNGKQYFTDIIGLSSTTMT